MIFLKVASARVWSWFRCEYKSLVITERFFYPYLNKLFVQGVIYYYSKAKSFIYKGELKFKQKLFKKV